VSPYELLAGEKIKGNRKSGLSFFEGLTPPSLSLCRPPGFFESKPFKPSKPSQPSQPSKPPKLSQPSKPSQPSQTSIISQNPLNSNHPVHPIPIYQFNYALQKSFPVAAKFWHLFLQVGHLPKLRKVGLYVFLRASYPVADGKSFVCN
jgi:hypothetical protein